MLIIEKLMEIVEKKKRNKKPRETLPGVENEKKNPPIYSADMLYTPAQTKPNPVEEDDDGKMMTRLSAHQAVLVVQLKKKRSLIKLKFTQIFFSWAPQPRVQCQGYMKIPDCQKMGERRKIKKEENLNKKK